MAEESAWTFLLLSGRILLRLASTWESQLPAVEEIIVGVGMTSESVTATAVTAVLHHRTTAVVDTLDQDPTAHVGITDLINKATSSYLE